MYNNKVRRYTPYLTAVKWQGQKDSNPRHVVLETTALPAELYPFGLLEYDNILN